MGNMYSQILWLLKLQIFSFLLICSLKNLEISNPGDGAMIILYLQCFMSKQFKYNV